MSDIVKKHIAGDLKGIRRCYALSRDLEEIPFKFVPVSDDASGTMLGCGAGSGPSAAREREVFGGMLLKDALDNTDESAIIIHYKYLSRAICAFDYHATKALWKKILLSPKDSTEKMFESLIASVTADSSGRVSLELLHFLAFTVQEPRLLYHFIFHAADKLKSSFPVSYGLKQSRKCLIPMVAALMDAFYYVRRQTSTNEFDASALLDIDPDDYKIDIATDRGCWFYIINELILLLPKRPTALWIKGDDAWTKPQSVSILQVATLCSEMSLKPLHTVLRILTFSSSALLDAFHTALFSGALRTHSLVHVLRGIYRAMIVSSRFECQSGETQRKLHQDVWNSVMIASSGWQTVTLLCTRAGNLSVPFASTPGDTRHPEIFIQIVEMLALLVDENNWPPYFLRNLIESSLDAVIKMSSKTYMVVKLLELREKAVKGCLVQSQYLSGTEFIVNILVNHYSVYATIENKLIAGFSELETFNRANAVVALTQLIDLSHRDGVMALVCSFGALPGEIVSAQFLDLYVVKMCKSLTKKATGLLGACTEHNHCAKAQADFRVFLQSGTFTDDMLFGALKTASRVTSAIAAEVLLLPPYNVRLPYSDNFTRHILEALLAPGEAAVCEVARTYYDRQSKP